MLRWASHTSNASHLERPNHGLALEVTEPQTSPPDRVAQAMTKEERAKQAEEMMLWERASWVATAERL